jgi:hypothetical protein
MVNHGERIAAASVRGTGVRLAGIGARPGRSGAACPSKPWGFHPFFDKTRKILLSVFTLLFQKSIVKKSQSEKLNHEFHRMNLPK